MVDFSIPTVCVTNTPPTETLSPPQKETPGNHNALPVPGMRVPWVPDTQVCDSLCGKHAMAGILSPRSTHTVLCDTASFLFMTGRDEFCLPTYRVPAGCPAMMVVCTDVLPSLGTHLGAAGSPAISTFLCLRTFQMVVQSGWACRFQFFSLSSQAPAWLCILPRWWAWAAPASHLHCRLGEAVYPPTNRSAERQTPPFETLGAFA